MKNGKKRFTVQVELWNVAEYGWTLGRTYIQDYDTYIESEHLPYIPRGKYKVPSSEWHEHRDLRGLNSRFVTYHFKKYNELKEIMNAVTNISSSNSTFNNLRLMWDKLQKSQQGIDKGLTPVFAPYRKGRIKTFLRLTKS